jgi:predicted nucleotidyltransferase component of viral defense system
MNQANQALEDMLSAYRSETALDFQNAVREIAQELALLALWRHGFFDHAAFYGGTALRIFHGLRRFSEDLDFTLLGPDDPTRIGAYLPGIETELNSWGFSFDVESRQKSVRSGIDSAFLKGNTQVNLLHIGAPEEIARRLPKSQKIRIKLEMDVDPPPFATTEIRTRLQPTPYQVLLYDLESLFAGKLHALLCRGWKNRVKGRDFYDFVWYAGKRVRPNLKHLEARMRQSGHWKEDEPLDMPAL